MLIAGDLDGDPAMIPCLAKGISAGTWLWLIPLVLVGSRTLLASSSVRIVWVLVGILLSVVLMRWLRLLLAFSLIGGALLIFQCLLALVLMGGRLILLALRSVSRSGLPAGLTLPNGRPRRLLVLSKMPGMFIGMTLRLFRLLSSLLSGMRFLCLV